MLGADADRAEGAPEGAVAGFQPPLDPSALIGRRWELGLACAALSTPDAAGLLTVTGAPGVGKTRLAVAAAWQLRTTFADGVRFLDLAETPSAERLLALVARALGARPGADDRATLARL